VILTTEEKRYTLTKDLLDQMRSLEGFPIGKDNDIISLSDPPYYTACPNPWIEEFIKENGKLWDSKMDSYNREPFASDVDEGKNDPLYMAHSYHTKVPHRAITRYILHYTEPGDIVFDGFCGTGMTGLAAQLCGNPDPEFKEKIDGEMPYVKWGERKAILNDLSPAATFLAYNYNKLIDVKAFETEAKRIIAEVKKECVWMFETQHSIDGKPVFEQDMNGLKKLVKGEINYTVLSDVFVCPSCSNEIVFWNAAVDNEKGKIRNDFNCPHCLVEVTKRSLDRAFEQVFDEALNTTVKRAKQVPVLINYSVLDSRGRLKRFEKKPDAEDLALIRKIDANRIPFWYPTDRMPDGYNTEQPKISHGVTHIHQFYTKRNLWVMASFFDKISSNIQRIHIISLAIVNSLLYRYRWAGGFAGAGGGPLSGTYYIPSLVKEISNLKSFNEYISKTTKKKEIIRNLIKQENKNNVQIESQSSSDLRNIPSYSIDYIFIDPPFGGNLMYSELNFMWESWLKVFTNNKEEALVNSVQRKGLPEYQHIMENCFKEFYRILKPGRWMTVEFHNSQNSVWMAIQEALSRAGFVVADVRTLDKQQGTFKQVTSTSAVKQDLIISAYKPNGGLEERFKLIAGTHEGVWDFIRQHLKHLPVFVEKDGIVQVVAERQSHLLFDRMIAFHVQRGVIVPISAGDFYAGLRQRFPERDGMYFLENEALEYDKKRMTSKKIEQSSLFVHDEKSAVQWIYTELREKSQTYQDIQPKFLQELHQDKFEKLPELTAMLEQNFLQDLKGQWYIPDPNKQVDLDKVRERALLKEFEEYKKTKGKLKLFRTEAVRAGFKKAWSERDYGMIITIGERLPSQILHEDDVLLMYYDNALTRQGKS